MGFRVLIVQNENTFFKTSNLNIFQASNTYLTKIFKTSNLNIIQVSNTHLKKIL